MVEIVRSGLDPASLELLDPACIRLFNQEKHLGLEESPTLFTEFHGPSMSYLVEILDMVEEICRDAGHLGFQRGLGRDERNRFFEARHELGEMVIRAHPDCGTQVIDVAVPMTAYSDIITSARLAADSAGIPGYAFSHAGDGNLHLNLAGRKNNPDDWKLIEDISRELVSKAISYGGTATGEHGVGIGKKGLHAGRTWKKPPLDETDQDAIRPQGYSQSRQNLPRNLICRAFGSINSVGIVIVSRPQDRLRQGKGQAPSQSMAARSSRTMAHFSLG